MSKELSTHDRDSSENAIASSSEEDEECQISPRMQSPAHVHNKSSTQGVHPPLSGSQNTEKLLFPHESMLTLPDFKKRPLTDTPIVSTTTSPNISNVNSKETSIESSPELKPVNNHLMSVPQLKIHKRRETTMDLPGITRTKTSNKEVSGNESEPGSKLVIVMCGLPARGKSYITNKLARYLNWTQYECRVFNVGNTRRNDDHHYGPSNGPLPDHEEQTNTTEHDASFFNPDNPSTANIREKWAIETLDQLLDYVLEGPGSVGIFDATNSTKARRRHIMKRIHERSKDLKILYLESICTDPSIVQKNVWLKLKGPDYKDMDKELALKDFTQRLRNYEKAYETIDDDEGLQYIKMIDVGKKVVAYSIQGFLASQTIYYLLNFNLEERQIWITRHGESEDNVLGRIGGDSGLTSRGDKFAKALSRFIESEKLKFSKIRNSKLEKLLEDGEISNIPDDLNFLVWTSMLKRAVETAKYFDEDEFYVKEVRLLNELSAGICEGLTYEEIQSKYPHEFESRLKDKLRYRYPGIGGESYLDVINRIRPIISEIERTTDNLLIVTHRVVARVLLGYFLNLNRDIITSLDIPLHCVYLLETKPYGVEWSLFEYSEEDDWFHKIPEEQMHHKKVKEVEVSHRERKFSVVPTVPPLMNSHARKSSGDVLETLNRVRGNPTGSNRNPAMEVDKLTEKLHELKTQRRG